MVLKDMVVSVTKKIDEARTKSPHDILNKRKVAHTMRIRFKLTLDHQRVPKVFKKFLGTILNGSFIVLKDMVFIVGWGHFALYDCLCIIPPYVHTFTAVL